MNVMHFFDCISPSRVMGIFYFSFFGQFEYIRQSLTENNCLALAKPFWKFNFLIKTDYKTTRSLIL